MAVRLRIDRIVVDGHGPGDARLLVGAFREELMRALAEPGAVEALQRGGAGRAGHMIEAATPAGQGRQAAQRLVRR